MADRELLDEVRRLRLAGASPKAIAHSLGVRPAVVAPLVRLIASEAHEEGGEADVAGCWVSPGWSRELIVVRRGGWDDVDPGPHGPAGLALVLVARRRGHDGVSVCGYLVNTFCLGVKNVIGPRRMHRRDLPSFSRTYFLAFPAPALRAPIELARHLVLGSIAYARELGLSPHPDFDGAREHLGELREPCAITFGREGRPLYVAGPHDDAIAILETLRSTVGAAGFSIAA